MKNPLVPVALLAFGLAVGCMSETSGGAANPSSQPSKKPAENTGKPEKPAEAPAKPKVEDIDAAAAAKLIAENSEVVILDIRTPGEFQMGHLKGAVNIDYKADDYAEKLDALDKEKTYLVH